jgi:nucleoside-diphosphate-sugar epimerase
VRVLLVGAARPLGNAIARRLAERGHEVTGTARQPREQSGLVQLDLDDRAGIERVAHGHDAAILTPILTVSQPAIAPLREAGIDRFVLFSSNNVAIDHQSPVYQALRAAEARAGDCRILRPTMIYGSPEDGNLSRLMTFARRSGFLVCPGSGRAMQQPVHIDDVAEAVRVALEGPASSGLHALGGPEETTMRELFRRILAAAGRRGGAVLPLPLSPALAAAGIAERMGLRLPLTTRQLKLFEEDKRARAPLLPDFQPSVGLDEGLGRLARQLARGRAGG